MASLISRGTSLMQSLDEISPPPSRILKKFVKRPYRASVMYTIVLASSVSQACPTLCERRDYIACQAPLSMEFPRQEYWSALPCPPPGDLPNPGIEPKYPVFPALAGGFFTTSTTWEAFCEYSTDLFYILVLMSISVLFSWVYC